MITEINKVQYNKVYEFIKQDNARNYFIRLGFESNKQVYEKIIGQWDGNGQLVAVLLKRLSGNLQFYAPDEFDAIGFAEYLSHMEFDSLISPRSCCDKLLDKGLFSSVKDGAIIAKLKSVEVARLESCLEVEPLSIEDLNEVVLLYHKIFTSFSSKSVMEERLRSGRGRGVCIRQDGRIISVVQSEFEEKDSALIVGVGTALDYQGKGYATKCLNTICRQLMKEGKDLYLQYDNMEAGRIYEMLGFKAIDQVRHYKR